MIEFVPASELHPDPRNTRRPHALPALIDSVRAHGVLSAVNADTGGRIVAGAHRVQACTATGDLVPVLRTPRLRSGDFDLALLTDNRLDEFQARPDLAVEVASATDDPRWVIGALRGDNPLTGLLAPDRLRLEFASRIVRRGVRGSVVADPATGKVIDGWVWATHARLTGEPVAVRWHPDPVDVRTAAAWHFTPETLPHPAEGRWGIQSYHRRLSPLWRMVLTEGEPGRVLDVGCGFGWHLAEVHPPWAVTGYEPYRRLRGAAGRIDRAWVRASIRRVALQVEHGLFDHAVLDHVLFLTGNDALAVAALHSAASLVRDDGEVWVSNMWHDLKSVGAVVDDHTRVNTRSGHRYVVRRWPREEMDALLDGAFAEVTLRHAGETHLYRCRSPRVRRDAVAVRTEFDLEFPDGSRPGVVDELLEVLAW